MTDFKDEKKLRLMYNAERQFSSIVNRNFLFENSDYSTAILDNGKFS